MSDALLTASVDTSGLERAIPQILEFGRRTMVEQCVTSAAYICKDASELTTVTPLSRIDADVTQMVTVKGGKTNRMTRGQAIVLARMKPDSKFNRDTGSRWAIKRPELDAGKFKKAYGDGGMAKRVFWEIVNNIETRQHAARRSSAGYIRSGWKKPITDLFASIYFRGYRRGANDRSLLNPLNSISGAMGDSKITDGGTSCMVEASNDVGESVGRSNATLARKHRVAALEHALPAAQAAVEHETENIHAEIMRRVEIGMPRINKLLA